MSSFVSLFVDRLSPASPQNPILVIKAPILPVLGLRRFGCGSSKARLLRV